VPVHRLSGRPGGGEQCPIFAALLPSCDPTATHPPGGSTTTVPATSLPGMSGVPATNPEVAPGIPSPRSSVGTAVASYRTRGPASGPPGRAGPFRIPGPAATGRSLGGDPFLPRSGDGHPVGNAFAHGHAYPLPHPVVHAHADAHVHAHTDPHAHGDPHPHAGRGTGRTRSTAGTITARTRHPGPASNLPTNR